MRDRTEDEVPDVILEDYLAHVESAKENAEKHSKEWKPPVMDDRS